MDGGHSAHVHTLRLWQRDRPVDTDENRFRNLFPLFVAQRRLTPLVISSILPSPFLPRLCHFYRPRQRPDTC